MTPTHAFKGKRRPDPRHDRSLGEVPNHTTTNRWSDEEQRWVQVCCDRPTFLHSPDLCTRCGWQWDSGIHEEAK